MRKNLFLAFIIALTVPQISKAIVTLRGSYGGLLSDKLKFNELCQGSCTNPQNAPSTGIPSVGYGVDGIVKLPLIPFGFGLRYEKLGLKADSNNISAESDLTRTAAIINYRFIDTIIHFGIIGTYGLSHSGSITVRESNNLVMDLKPDKFESYSIGAELEVKPLIVIPLIVGAELGYQAYKWKDTYNSVNSTTQDLDLSGTYLKIFLGFDI